MTTTEILAAFTKGLDRATISQKQKDWLLSQAKKDGIKLVNDGFSDRVCLTDCYYSIKGCTQKASGGSYVGTRTIQGRYNIEKMYTIKFDSIGLVSVYSKQDLTHFQTTGHSFKIINQL